MAQSSFHPPQDHVPILTIESELNGAAQLPLSEVVGEGSWLRGWLTMVGWRAIELAATQGMERCLVLELKSPSHVMIKENGQMKEGPSKL
jgi:hypothetical protein